MCGCYCGCRKRVKAILREKVINEKVPILGICLGMQLLTEKSYEDEETRGLELVPAQVHRLKPNDPRLRVPHVGWNNIVSTGDNVLFQGNLPQQPDFYFVHSYFVSTVGGAPLSTIKKYISNQN